MRTESERSDEARERAQAHWRTAINGLQEARAFLGAAQALQADPTRYRELTRLKTAIDATLEQTMHTPW